MKAPIVAAMLAGVALGVIGGIWNWSAPALQAGLLGVALAYGAGALWAFWEPGPNDE